MKKTPSRDSLRLPENRLVFRQGLRDGVPIGLGYQKKNIYQQKIKVYIVQRNDFHLEILI